MHSVQCEDTRSRGAECTALARMNSKGQSEYRSTMRSEAQEKMSRTGQSNAGKWNIVDK